MASLPIPFMVNYYLNHSSIGEIGHFVVIVTSSILSVVCVVWIVGLTKDMRLKVANTVKSRLMKK